MSESYSTSETGHTKNLENFKRLYEVCERNTPPYNPTLDKIKLVNLSALIVEAEKAHTQVLDAKSAVITTTNDRQILYQPLEKLATRVVQALQASTENKKIVTDARGFLNKIRGKFSRPKTKDDEEGQEIARTVSNSQQSYDKLREHFESLILILEKETDYNPNEVELKTATLRAYLLSLKQAEEEITLLKGLYNKALIKRDKIFYDTEESLVPVSASIKAYLKSLFGIKSLEYLEVNKIAFRYYRRK